jgi:HAD superfamily hydrolase (TIGR01509 family)
MTAILFGSISSVADTSELQRTAFNEAFAQHGLDWTWEREEYQQLLRSNGGADRVAAYAEQRGEQVDAAAVHATKSEIFQKRLSEGVEPRPGVVESIAAARAAGAKVGLVTTTSPANVASLISALSPEVEIGSFDVVVDSDQVDAPKPDGAAYTFALEQLGEQAADCVAVEDNVGGVESATAAGVPVVAFPNENTAGHSFEGATATVDELDYAELRDLGASA